MHRLPGGRFAEMAIPSLPATEDEFGVPSRVVGRVESCASDEIARAELAAAPWWLWWNVLSLDAPMVAVAWALVFARAARVRLPGSEVAVLGLVVWLIYTVDRLLDGRPAATASGSSPGMKSGADAFGSPLRQRHVFHRLYARAIACTAAGVGTFAAILVANQIGERVLEFAVPLGLILVLYMAWVHLGRGRVLARLPKEVAVGGVFAAGVALPVWSRIDSRRWEFFSLAILFAAVCMLNCVAIEEWERVRAHDLGDHGGRSVATRVGSGKFAAVLAVCAGLMTPVVQLRGEFSAIGAAIAVSALLILFLDLVRERISAEALRVLVDVALLLPALAVLALPF
ncbi:MAG TPA: hypothetical protein VMP12_02150 [Candidatus Sulfotelmatobacter sp.]|nr:hypothetical protein [Candidatus Sulfotelmatobacter sp.]